MGNSLNYLAQGLLLGLGMGILPGPVMVIIISRILELGSLEGLKIAFGALFVDIVRICAVVLLLNALPQSPMLLGVAGMAGAIFLFYLGYQSLCYKIDLDSHPIRSGSVWLGLLANLLNPSGYLFWLTVGGSIIFASHKAAGSSASLAFVLGFLFAIFGINVLIGLLAGKVKVYLKSNYYLYTVRALGLALIFFALVFVNQSLHYFIN